MPGVLVFFIFSIFFSSTILSNNHFEAGCGAFLSANNEGISGGFTQEPEAVFLPYQTFKRVFTASNLEPSALATPGRYEYLPVMSGFSYRLPSQEQTIIPRRDADLQGFDAHLASEVLEIAKTPKPYEHNLRNKFSTSSFFSTKDPQRIKAWLEAMSRKETKVVTHVEKKEGLTLSADQEIGIGLFSIISSAPVFFGSLLGLDYLMSGSEYKNDIFWYGTKYTASLALAASTYYGLGVVIAKILCRPIVQEIKTNSEIFSAQLKELPELEEMLGRTDELLNSSYGSGFVYWSSYFKGISFGYVLEKNAQGDFNFVTFFNPQTFTRR